MKGPLSPVARSADCRTGMTLFGCLGFDCPPAYSESIEKMEESSCGPFSPFENVFPVEGQEFRVRPEFLRKTNLLTFINIH